jgi:hypothetical protein
MKKLVFILFILCSFDLLAGDWVWPTMPTSEPKTRTFEVKEIYDYSVEEALKLLPINLGIEQSDKFFEEIFRKRFNAIKSQDYQTWFNTWTNRSQVELSALNEQRGYTKDTWLKGWKEQYTHADFYIAKKIEYKQFVILVYKIGYKSKQPLGNSFEFPMVLVKKADKTWGVSSALKANPLLIYSPWVKDITLKTIKIK